MMDNQKIELNSGIMSLSDFADEDYYLTFFPTKTRKKQICLLFVDHATHKH